MKTLAALLIALLVATSALAEGAEKLRVLAECEVYSDSVTLADVVENAPAGFDRVVLGASPRPGCTVKYNAEWVRAKAANVTDVAALEVPEVVLVTRPGRDLTREEVEAAVVSALEKRYGDEYEVTIESVSLPPTLNDGELALDVRLPRGKLNTKTSLPIDALVNGKVEGHALARIETRLANAPQVVVVVNSVRRGSVIRSSDVELSSVPARRGSLTETEAAVGRAAARTLSPGTVLTSDQLTEPTLVAKGQTVRLVARVGRVMATASGKALGAGALGDTVSVENATSGQVVQGVVREAGLVETIAPAMEVN